MGAPQSLLNEYRGGLLECFHPGSIAVYSEEGLVHGLGDTDFLCYYRSASKPIQSLPALALGLDEKYGLTDEELSIMSGSLWCGPRQVELMKSIMQKGDIRYETLIMQPGYPLGEVYALPLRAAGEPPSKLYHNCIGKHLALILIQRELGGPEADYYKIESAVQQKVLHYLAEMTDLPAADIQVGIDGCGVPVFAVPLEAMAKSFLRLAAPDLIASPEIAAAAVRNARILEQYPENLMDARALCGVLCRDANLIGKIGAQGVYALGLKKERIGVAVKLYDGVGANFPLVLARILELLDYQNSETIARLRSTFPPEVLNATGAVVGMKCAEFDFAF
ncbi:MAG: asparaginase [Clostridiales bacterium]|nr:asparaginase [Clostridiales bacterium]